MTIFGPRWAIHSYNQKLIHGVQPEANTWPFPIISEPFTVSYNQRLIHDHFRSSKSLSLYHTTRGKYMIIFRPSRAFHCIVQPEANFPSSKSLSLYHTTRGKYMTIFHPLWVFHCIMQPDANNNTLPFSVLYEHFTVSYNQRLIHDHFPSSKSLSLYHTTRVKYMTIFRPLWVFHCIMQPDANSNTWPFSILYELFTVSCKQRLIDDNFPSSVSLSLYHRTWG